jgi:hypothetical protein
MNVRLKKHKWSNAWGAGILVLLWPSAAKACEPVVALMMLYSGPVLGGVMFSHSALGLLLAIILKTGVFLWKSDLKKGEIVGMVIASNLYSSLPALSLVLLFGVPAIGMIVLPILYCVLFLPARGLKRYRHFSKYNSGLLSAGLMVAVIISMVLFGVMMGAQDNGPLWLYWILKILTCIVAIGISFGITIVCEEYIISMLYEKKHNEKKIFLEPVVWANAAVFAAMVLTGAIIALPHRFASSNFLISIFTALGVA